MSDHEKELRRILDHCAEVEPATKDRIEKTYAIESEEERLRVMELLVGSIWAALEEEGDARSTG